MCKRKYSYHKRKQSMNYDTLCGDGDEKNTSNLCVPIILLYSECRRKYVFHKLCGDGTRKDANNQCVPNYDNIICAKENILTINEEGQSMCVPNYDTLCEDKPNWNNSCKYVDRTNKRDKRNKMWYKSGSTLQMETNK